MNQIFTNILFFLTLSLSGCNLFFANRPASQNQHVVPKDWSLYDTGHGVIFFAPSYLRQVVHNELQTDSEGVEFTATNMQILTDYGLYSNNLETYRNSVGYEEEEIIINNKKGKVCIFRVKNASESYSGSDTMKHIVAAYFYGGSGQSSLLFWISCKGESEQLIAKTIIHSIKFKE